MNNSSSWKLRTVLWAIVVLAAGSAHAEVNFFRLFKSQGYQQTSNAQPSTADTYGGTVDILYTNDPGFTNAQVNSTSPLSPMVLSPVPGAYSFGQTYATSSELETNFPDNTIYAFGVSGGSLGNDAAALNTPANGLFASQVPYFNGTTYDQLQGMDASSSFNFTFDGYTAPGGANNPLTFFDIVRVSDGAVVYSDVGPNTQTSFLLPAGTLQAGTAYSVDLIYSSRFDAPNAGLGGATSEVGYDLRTNLNFTTAVPEPSSLVLALLGTLAFVGSRWAKAARR